MISLRSLITNCFQVGTIKGKEISSLKKDSSDIATSCLQQRMERGRFTDLAISTRKAEQLAKYGQNRNGMERVMMLFFLFKQHQVSNFVRRCKTL